MIDHPLTNRLPTISTLPGCYIYRNAEGKVLYVGKAKNLRKRVTSYFRNYKDLTARIQIMIDNAVDLEINVVDSEVEALILESTLIKKYKPRYNVMLKDDKDYSWIKITKEPYPIIYRTRDIKDRKAKYFGPFTSVIARDQIYDFLRRNFPFRSCSYSITDEDLQNRKERRLKGERVASRICTFYHIKKCGAPCEGLVSNEEYNENIANIEKFLKSRKKVLLKELETKMEYFAKTQQFERAAKTKEQLDSLSFVSQKMMIGRGDDEDDVRRLEYQRSMKGLENLIKKLKIVNFKDFSKEEKANYLDNFRIECYDISNIQGTNPVGSMVVNIGGVMNKSHYRKFKINVKETPDDFAMMREMLTRRFRYLRPKNEIENLDEHNVNFINKISSRPVPDAGSDSSKLLNVSNPKNTILSKTHSYKKRSDISFDSVPDLIIIDGGKGQLKIATEVLHDLKLDNLKVCGLAKRREEIFLPGEKQSYLFDDKKETLFLLQRIRDEAHRFGLTYHRLRRSKGMFNKKPTWNPES